MALNDIRDEQKKNGGRKSAMYVVTWPVTWSVADGNTVRLLDPEHGWMNSQVSDSQALVYMHFSDPLSMPTFSSNDSTSKRAHHTKRPSNTAPAKSRRMTIANPNSSTQGNSLEQQVFATGEHNHYHVIRCWLRLMILIETLVPQKRKCTTSREKKPETLQIYPERLRADMPMLDQKKGEHTRAVECLTPATCLQNLSRRVTRQTK